MRVLVVFCLVLLCLRCIAASCSTDESTNGCKMHKYACTCGYGCKNEFIYNNLRTCLNALKGNPYRHSRRIKRLELDKSSNICYQEPCMRGICIQKQQEPGFSCKCEGTGYYGQRCEKACPTYPLHGLIYPHECIII